MLWSHPPESLPANSLYPLPQCGHCLQIESCELHTPAEINHCKIRKKKHTEKFWPTCNCYSLSEAKGDLLWVTLNTLELHALGVPIYLGQEHGLPVKSKQNFCICRLKHVSTFWWTTKSCFWFKGMSMSIFIHTLVLSNKVVRAMQCRLGKPGFTHCDHKK